MRTSTGLALFVCLMLISTPGCTADSPAEAPDFSPVPKLLEALKPADGAPVSAQRDLLAFAERVDDVGGNWHLAQSLYLRLLALPKPDAEVTSRVLSRLQNSADEYTGVQPLLEFAGKHPEFRPRVAQVLASMNGRNISREINRRFPSLEPALQQELTATLSRRLDLAETPDFPPGVQSRPDRTDWLLQFTREKLSTHTFEAASVADLNKDGKPDIVQGGYWFPGPDFHTSHKICEVKPSGEYFDDFSDYPMDINGDGYPDLITGGFFGGPLRWRENPKGGTGEWAEHPIAQIGSIETTRFWDVDGDGFPEICPNAGGNITVFRLKRDAAGRGTGEFTRHSVKKGGIGHGLGFGDVNGDGRGDFIGPDGWYEAPAKPLETEEWPYHREFRLGSASVPILVRDVNGDGRNDLIVGQGHAYGLEWIEQKAGAGGTREWIHHTVEADRSQFHELFEADLDNDGTSEVITGKRWRAHNDNDPGAHDPVGLYVYKFERGNVTRSTLNYGPADRNSGTGIYLWAEDVDSNGWKDIVAAGKEGLYLFRNFGPPKEAF